MTLRRRAHRFALRGFARLPRPVRRRLVRAGTPSFVVGAMGVVVVDGEVLLARQSYRRGWGVPGGLLDRGEAPEAAVVRELREEAGIAVVVDGPAATVVEPRLRRVDLCFRCSPAPGADRHAARPTSPEIDEVGWFPLDALPKLQPESRTCLEAVGITVPGDEADDTEPA